MEVYFYTGSFTHTMYREQAQAVPDGVRIIGSSADLSSTGLKKDIDANDNATYRSRRWLKRAALRAIVRLGVPNVRYLRPPPCDLIHSAQYPLLNRTPWVVDFEDASVFAWYDPSNLRRRHVRGALERLFQGDACRWILPWTEAARESLLNALDCTNFAAKIKVVYPAIRPAVRAQPREDDEVRLLFVGTAFYYKGGLETLLAFRRLSERLHVTLTMVSFVPPEILRQFEGLRGLKLRSRVSPAELESLYQTSDVFVAPYHTDTFGFVILEAFAHGIPCVTVKQFATPEIVTDGVTGLVVDNSVSRFGSDRLATFSMLGRGPNAMLRELANPPQQYVDSLAGALEALARDRSTRMAMAEAAFREVSEGRFAVAARRRALETVYASSSKQRPSRASSDERFHQRPND